MNNFEVYNYNRGNQCLFKLKDREIILNCKTDLIIIDKTNTNNLVLKLIRFLLKL